VMYVLVLNDGETYTALRNCVILRIDDSLADYPDLDGVVKDAAATYKELGWLSTADKRIEFVTAFH